MSRRQVPTHATPLVVALTFEASGAWPDDVDALGDVKSALHLQLADSLNRQSGGAATACVDYVDVVHDGLPFRLCVFHKRELSLLRERGTARQGVSRAPIVAARC